MKNLLTKVFREGLKPIEKIDCATFAEKYFVLPSTSAEPGKYKLSRTPYAEDILKAFTQPGIKKVVVMSSSQVAKTTCMLIVLARFIAVDPCNILMVLPTLELAQDISKDRLESMIRDCPILTPLFYADGKKSRDKNQTMLSKFFKGGRIILVGANSPTGLSSRPIRLLLCDEVDRFSSSAGIEGDPIKLAETRQATYWNKITGLFSTPTIENVSRIEAEYKLGTMEEWQYQCPNCHEYHAINYEDITINYKYRCPDCGYEFDELTMKKSPQKYIAHRKADGIRSFWLNAFSSPWMSWKDIMKEWEESKGDPEREQTVFNTKFGRTYRQVGAFESENLFLQRLETYDAEVPSGVKILVASVDVQDNRLEYEICGFNETEECWGIVKGVVFGMPNFQTTWDKLDTYLDREYQTPTGIMTVSRVFIDSGGHFTTSVYEYCRKNQIKGRVAIKGLGQSGIKLLHKVTTAPNYPVQLQILGVNEGKQQVMNRLAIEKPGPLYFHFPIEDYKLETPRGYDVRYFRGLIAERKVYRQRGGQMQEVWESIHKRNESLDLRVYNISAFQSLKDNLKPTVKPARRRLNKSANIDLY